jgi:hypothetical protein
MPNVWLFCRPAVWYLGCLSFSNEGNRIFDPPTLLKLDIRVSQNYMGAAWNWIFVMVIISSPGQLTPGTEPHMLIVFGLSLVFNFLHTLHV